MRSRPRRPPVQVLVQDELQLSVFVSSGDRYGGRPLYCEIVDRALAARLGGATVVRGAAGFGATGKLHSPGLTGLCGSEPVLIEITDDPARVRAFLPVLDEIVGSGLVVLRPVTVRRSAADAPDVAASAAT